MGAKYKHQNLPLIRELNDNGYNTANLHILLKCTKADAMRFFRETDRMKLGQIKEISLAIGKPLNYCINQLLRLPKQSLNWMEEDYDPAQRIAELKSR